MTNAEKIQNSKIKYSPQARLIIESLNFDFPIEEFEKWIEDQEKISIGGAWALEWLELRAGKVQNEIDKIAKSITKLP